MVDEFDRLRVPPDDPRYTLRRVWLSERRGARLLRRLRQRRPVAAVPHCAHPAHLSRRGLGVLPAGEPQVCRSPCWKRWRAAPTPSSLCRITILRCCRGMVKAARPDARVAIFWHIPWPNPEAFGICPWQAELLEGLLGADLIGFHIPLHCNNFLATVDRVLESRTDREHMTVRRHGHTTTVRPYPVSVAIDPAATAESTPPGARSPATSLLREFGVRAREPGPGRRPAGLHQGHRGAADGHRTTARRASLASGALTMVQIAAPSRTRIPSYAELRRRVEETVERINQRFQTARLASRRADRAPMQPRGGDTLVSRRRPVPGHLAARRHEPGGQGVPGRARRRGRRAGAEQVHRRGGRVARCAAS